MYYLRTQAASQAVKFTVENQAGKNMEPVIPAQIDQAVEEITDGPVCSMEEGCISCSG
jgi:ribonucleoside-diphosphate reductase alpha chain